MPFYQVGPGLEFEAANTQGIGTSYRNRSTQWRQGLHDFASRTGQFRHYI